jgi:hypothetical protein
LLGTIKSPTRFLFLMSINRRIRWVTDLDVDHVVVPVILVLTETTTSTTAIALMMLLPAMVPARTTLPARLARFTTRRRLATTRPTLLALVRLPVLTAVLTTTDAPTMETTTDSMVVVSVAVPRVALAPGVAVIKSFC